MLFSTGSEVTLRLRSWVESANEADADFTIDNLPFGVFRTDGEPRCGMAIGDQIVDLRACRERDLLSTLDAPVRQAAAASSLDALLALGRSAGTALRDHVQGLLLATASHRDVPLVGQKQAAMLMPCTVGDYTDFYAFIDHATNVGSMFRPDNPLLPNYKYVPIGYHGRASSIVVSGSAFHRPRGQIRDDASAPPVFAPTGRLDYEAEVGFWIGGGNAPGQPIPIDQAEEHVFGMCLVNDWSARDVQSWEYQPLGPFLAKSFATTVSPWIVTLDGLAPFRTAQADRDAGDPSPLPHLAGGRPDAAIDLNVEVWLRTQKMTDPVRISRGSFAKMYWTIAQLVAHHTSNGCNLRPRDLLASGTVSGSSKESRGCLLERTWRGTEPIELPGGESRRFLEDGDEVILRAWAERDGVRVGFGECRGTVLPALE